MPRMSRKLPPKLPTDFSALVQMLPPAAIHDEVAYKNAQETIDALTTLPELTEGQSKYLDTLSVLAEVYEDERHAIDVSGVTPVDVLKTLMDAHGMSASDVGRLLGERSLG